MLPSPGCGSGISEALLGGCEGSPFPADLLHPTGGCHRDGDLSWVLQDAGRDVSRESGLWQPADGGDSLAR